MRSLLFVPVLLLFAGTPAQPSPVAEEESVETVKPVRRTLTRKIEQPGEIQAFEQAPLYARLSGYVLKVHKDIGDPVKDGEVLAELSVPEINEELKQKTALVTQAKVEVKLSKKLVGVAEADSKSAQAKVKEAETGQARAIAEQRRADSQFERLKKSKGVVAQEVIDEGGLALETAKAAVSENEARVRSAEAGALSAKARFEKSEVDVDVADARQGVAESDERRTAAMLNYAKLRAPFPGIVIKRNIDAGHFLQPGEGKREPAFVVARMNPVRVWIEVPENDAVLVRDGVRATVTVEALKGESFKGEVSRSAWALDPKSRTLRAEIDLKNPEGRLRPGMYVRTVLHVERANVLAVPSAAVLTQGDESYCFLFEKGKAMRTVIKIGFRDASWTELQMKKTGDKEGTWEAVTDKDKVITSNLTALKDGQEVKETSK